MAFLLEVIRTHILQRELEKCKLLRETAIKHDREGIDESNLRPNFWERNYNKWKSFKLNVKQTRIGRFLHCVFRKGTFANYIFRSISGFSIGALLILLLQAMLIFQVNMSVNKATLVSALLAPFFCLGLAFSTRVRCAFFIVMPQLCSKRGRQALIAVAYILTFNGPANNTLYNLGEMVHSISCGQEQTRIAMGRLAKVIKEPFITAKRAVQKAMKAVKDAITQLRKSVAAIETIISGIVSVMRFVSNWLHSVVNTCNRSMGTPSERCFRVLERAMHDCNAALGPVFSFLCYTVRVGDLFCYLNVVLDVICQIVNLITDSVAAKVQGATAKFKAKMHMMFYADVDIQHSFEADTDSGNRTVKSIVDVVMSELDEKMKPVKQVCSLAGGALGFTWLFVFFNALRYYQKFMTKDRFDNRYITQQLKEIDLTRASRGLECVLPLRMRERKRFCRPTQLRLLPHERRQIAKTMVFLVLSTVFVGLQIYFDYGLYWLLDVLHKHSAFVTHIAPAQAVKLDVGGDGIVPNLFRNLSQSLYEEETATELPPPELDPTSCLPNPMPPDINTYYKIMNIFVFVWLTTFLEPWLLRLRPAFMSLYHPERAHQRAVWLTGYILRERGGALRTMAHLTGRRTSVGGSTQEPLNIAAIMERLKDRSKLFRLLLGGKSRPACIVCATSEETHAPLFPCEALGCKARYCRNCYEAQENTCYRCNERMHQPAIPGLELELDSSDEEPEEILVHHDEVDEAVTKLESDLVSEPSFVACSKSSSSVYPESLDSLDLDPRRQSTARHGEIIISERGNRDSDKDLKFEDALSAHESAQDDEQSVSSNNEASEHHPVRNSLLRLAGHVMSTMRTPSEYQALRNEHLD